MSSDRGTIPRGSAGADGQVPWTEPTAVSGRRLPSAPRERKPLLVVLALLLIVLGAGGAGLLVQKMNNKVGAIEVSQNVNEGNPITASDLTEVMVPSDSGFNYVTWNSVSAVTNPAYTAAINIPAGTLLTQQMVAKNNNLVNGRDKIGLSLKDGQFPNDVAIGETVEIYSTADQTPPSCSGASRVLAPSATVLGVSTPSGDTGVTDVELAIEPQYADAVVCFTANNDAGLAVLNPNSTG
jgi:hypothetical protein